MRRIDYIVLIMIVALTLNFSSLSIVYGAKELPKSQVIYEVDDPIGDEYGTGTYVYPLGPVFDPGKGLYDIEHFKVTLDLENAYFDVTFSVITNPWGAPEGFSHQRFQIYINETAYKGRSETLREGAYVYFDGKYGWEYLINVVGWNNTSIYGFEDDKNSNGSTEGVATEVLADGKTIRVTVPKKYLGPSPDKWQYYVLSGAQDGLGPDNYRIVNTETSEWYFGGGTDSVFNPNVIDMLVPEGVTPKQEEQLSSYDLATGSLAEIKPVGPKPGEVKIIIREPTKWDPILLYFSDFMNKINFSTYYPVYLSISLAVIIFMLLIYINFVHNKKQ